MIFYSNKTCPTPVLHTLVVEHPDTETIRILLEKKFNPSYRSFYSTYHGVVSALDLARGECKKLLKQYKRVPENTSDMIYSD